jgi:hypothetical protein
MIISSPPPVSVSSSPTGDSSATHTSGSPPPKWRSSLIGLLPLANESEIARAHRICHKRTPGEMHENEIGGENAKVRLAESERDKER